MTDQKNDHASSIDGIINEIFQNIPPLVRSSHYLPKGEDDFEYYRTFPSFIKFVQEHRHNILTNIGDLLKQQGLKESFSALASDSSIDIDDLTEGIIQCNDVMIEKAQCMIEEISKLKNKNENELKIPEADRNRIVSSWNKYDRNGNQTQYRLIHSTSIARPQSQFKDKIDNSTAPFIPKISYKPHAIKALPKALININSNPVDDNVSPAVSNLINSLKNNQAEDMSIYEHPYEVEITSFKPDEWQLTKLEPIMYSEMISLSTENVTSKIEDLKTVVEELKLTSEIAVDLEHHSYRSYLGITCLMQISTREKDYIIDTIALRSDLHILNEVFTDPKILKVFHGSNMDIIWLQRDFGLYVVNMFDTYIASKSLELSRGSLKYLLEHYCGVDVSKQHQLADWRVRPLTSELINYAQGDTHYLLYIYDRMRNELIDSNNGSRESLLAVLDDSKKICLKRFIKPQLNHETHREMLSRYNRNPRKKSKNLNPYQLYALKQLYAWRDSIARREDESIGYVLPNHMLIQIAEVMPRDAQGVLALCNPLPPLVRQNVLEIHSILQSIIDSSLDEVVANYALDIEEENKTTKKNMTNEEQKIIFNNSISKVHDSSNTISYKDLKSIQKVRSHTSQGTDLFGISKPESTVGCNQNQMTWNPVKMFLPNGMKAKKSDEVNDTEPPTLQDMLTGKFDWKLEKVPENMKPKVSKVDEVKKSFGTVITIDPSNVKSTEDQILLVGDLIDSAKKSTSQTKKKKKRKGDSKNGNISFKSKVKKK